MYTFDDGKPSLEELQHFGVKGMRWGVVKSKVGAVTGAYGKATNRGTGKEIRTARKNVRAEKDKLKDQEKRVKSAKKGSAERASGQKKLMDMKASFLKNPDRATAARLTRGEFWALQGAGVVALSTTGFLLPAVAGTGVAVTKFARSKSIAKKQASGS